MTYLKNKLNYLVVDHKCAGNTYFCFIYDKQYKLIHKIYLEQEDINTYYQGKPTAAEIAKLLLTEI